MKTGQTKRIGVLALQGAFAEHEIMLHRLGAETIQLRQRKDLEQPIDGLVLPGGESTVQAKLLHELGMFEILQKQIQEGLPVLATCAGMILLASHFQTFPGQVKRNAYGRQLGSFQCVAQLKGIGEIPMTFIRAPYFTEVGNQAQVLAKVDGRIVAAKYQNQLALAFHPEVTDNDSVHRYFLETFHSPKGSSSRREG